MIIVHLWECHLLGSRGNSLRTSVQPGLSHLFPGRGTMSGVMHRLMDTAQKLSVLEEGILPQRYINCHFFPLSIFKSILSIRTGVAPALRHSGHPSLSLFSCFGEMLSFPLGSEPKKKKKEPKVLQQFQQMKKFFK